MRTSVCVLIIEHTVVKFLCNEVRCTFLVVLVPQLGPGAHHGARDARRAVVVVATAIRVRELPLFVVLTRGHI